MTIKALSVRQPWAFAISTGVKRIENRSKPWGHRGEILIQAGQIENIEDVAAVLRALAQDSGESVGVWRRRYAARRALGCIVARVTIVDCVRRHPSIWFTGPFGYVLADAQALAPLRYPGKQGPFEVPDEIVAALRPLETDDRTGDLFA